MQFPCLLINTILCALPFPPCSGSIIISSLQHIVKTEGFKGLYRGLSPTIMALLPNWAVSIVYVAFSFLRTSS